MAEPVIATPRLLAIDPGKTTGICLASGIQDGKPTSWMTAEASFFEAADFVQRVLDDDPEVTIVVERFTISERTIKLGRDHNAIELTGVIRWLSFIHGLPEPLYAGPADVKRLVTDQRLRDAGAWHRGGGGHANDASRHAIYWLVRANLFRLT